MNDPIQNRGTPERILVVDDDEPMRQIIVSMLVHGGYECREAVGGLEALALLESGEEFDLMLTNLMMPQMDGIVLLARTKDKYSDMPVVLETSVYDVSVVVTAIRNGAFDYLLRPFDRDQLLAVMRRALDHHRSTMEQRAYVASLESQVATLTEQLRHRKS